MPQTPRFVRKRPQGEPSKGNHSASTPDETSAKVSRLAAITSVSAFLATGCLVFAAVTSSQASSGAQTSSRGMVISAMRLFSRSPARSTLG